jgi:hypothetical protein
MSIEPGRQRTAGVASPGDAVEDDDTVIDEPPTLVEDDTAPLSPVLAGLKDFNSDVFRNMLEYSLDLRVLEPLAGCSRHINQMCNNILERFIMHEQTNFRHLVKFERGSSLHQ